MRYSQQSIELVGLREVTKWGNEAIENGFFDAFEIKDHGDDGTFIRVVIGDMSAGTTIRPATPYSIIRTIINIAVAHQDAKARGFWQ